MRKKLHQFKWFSIPVNYNLFDCVCFYMLFYSINANSVYLYYCVCDWMLTMECYFVLHFTGIPLCPLGIFCVRFVRRWLNLLLQLKPVDSTWCSWHWNHAGDISCEMVTSWAVSHRSSEGNFSCTFWLMYVYKRWFKPTLKTAQVNIIKKYMVMFHFTPNSDTFCLMPDLSRSMQQLASALTFLALRSGFLGILLVF